mgnify:CR=1 FL=1|jgi:hypothetical protein
MRKMREQELILNTTLMRESNHILGIKQIIELLEDVWRNNRRRGGL